MSQNRVPVRPREGMPWLVSLKYNTPIPPSLPTHVRHACAADLGWRTQVHLCGQDHQHGASGNPISAKALARELVKYGELAQVDGLAASLQMPAIPVTLQVLSWLTSTVRPCYFSLPFARVLLPYMVMSLGAVVQVQGAQRRSQAWPVVRKREGAGVTQPTSLPVCR